MATRKPFQFRTVSHVPNPHTIATTPDRSENAMTTAQPDPYEHGHPENNERAGNNDGLLTLRSAVIFMLAFVGAVVTGALTFLLFFSVPGALLAAFSAFMTVTYFGMKVIR